MQTFFFVLPYPLSRANSKQTNLSVSRANLSDAATSTKLAPQKCKNVRECRWALWVVRVWFGLIEVQGDSARRKEKEGIRVFVLFPLSTLKYLEVQSSNRKNHHYL